MRISRRPALQARRTTGRALPSCGGAEPFPRYGGVLCAGGDDSGRAQEAQARRSRLCAVREHEVLVFLYGGQSVLALHRSAAQGAYWHSVAGGVEPGEDAPAAAVRELAEETGLHSETVRPLGHS